MKSGRTDLVTVCVLALVLGFGTLSLAQFPGPSEDMPGVVGPADAIWIADKCHLPINTTGATPPRTYAECCGAKCGEYNSGVSLDLCIAGCLALA